MYHSVIYSFTVPNSTNHLLLGFDMNLKPPASLGIYSLGR